MSAKTMVDTWVRMSSRDGGTGMYVSHGILLMLKDCIDSEFADRVKARGLREELFSLGHKYERLQAENDALREFLRRLMYHIENPPCESCMAEMTCMGDVSQCDDYFDLLKPEAREKFGIEVDE